MKVDYHLGHSNISFYPEAYFAQETLTLYYLEQSDDELMKEAVAAELSSMLFRRDYRQHEDTVLRVLGANKVKAKRFKEQKGWERLLTKDEIDLIEKLLADKKINTKKGHEDSQTKNQVKEDGFKPTNVDEIIGSKNSKIDTYSNNESGTNFTESYQASNSSRPKKPSGASNSNQNSKENTNKLHSLSNGFSHTKPDNDSKTQSSSSSSRDYSEGYRLLSYVSSDPLLKNSESSIDEANQSNKAIGDKAEQLVAEQLRSAGYKVTLLGGNNPGYDIEALDTKTGVLYFIEVKAIRGNWNSTGVGLSETQFKKCLEHQDHYWMFVVERMSSEPVIHKIVNPASKVHAYYFDQNWQYIAEPQNVENREIYIEDLLDDNCQLIYLEVNKRGLPQPEIGFDVQNEVGQIIANIELAWPSAKIGICLDAEELSVPDWNITSVSDVLSNLDWLERIEFNK